MPASHLLRKNEAVLLREELDLDCMANTTWPMDRCYVRHGSSWVASKKHEGRSGILMRQTNVGRRHKLHCSRVANAASRKSGDNRVCGACRLRG